MSLRGVPNRLMLLQLVLGLGIVGCSKCHGRLGPQRRPVPSAAPIRAAACTPTRHSSGYVDIDVRGQRRRFYLVPPSGAGAVSDVIIGFHGRGRSGEYSANYWALGESSRRPFVAIYPDGVPQAWFRKLVGWDTRSEASTDLPFYDAMVAWAAAQYCIERPRIHLIGHSWGGGMANLVACARPDATSIVSVGGGGPTFPCHGPVAAMVVHGTADQDEPLASGHTNVTSWAFYNRCGSGQSPASVEGCVQFGDCLEDHPLLWCEHPGGHGWPDLLRNGKLLAWFERD